MNRRAFLSALSALPLVGPALVVAASRTRSRLVTIDNIEPKLGPAFTVSSIDGKARLIIRTERSSASITEWRDPAPYLLP